jgi:hypothetical protein
MRPSGQPSRLLTQPAPMRIKPGSVEGPMRRRITHRHWDTGALPPPEMARSSPAEALDTSIEISCGCREPVRAAQATMRYSWTSRPGDRLFVVSRRQRRRWPGRQSGRRRKTLAERPVGAMGVVRPDATTGARLLLCPTWLGGSNDGDDEDIGRHSTATFETKNRLVIDGRTYESRHFLIAAGVPPTWRYMGKRREGRPSTTPASAAGVPVRGVVRGRLGARSRSRPGHQRPTPPGAVADRQARRRPARRPGPADRAGRSRVLRLRRSPSGSGGGSGLGHRSQT